MLATHTSAAPGQDRRLRDELEILREENRQLRALLVPVAYLPAAWKLTNHCTRLVCALAKARGGIVTVERLFFVLQGFEADMTSQTLRVQICNIRRRRDLHGLDVITHRDLGYSMPVESCERVLAAMR